MPDIQLFRHLCVCRCEGGRHMSGVWWPDAKHLPVVTSGDVTSLCEDRHRCVGNNSSGINVTNIDAAQINIFLISLVDQATGPDETSFVVKDTSKIL